MRDGWEWLWNAAQEQVREGTLKNLAVGLVAHARTGVVLLRRSEQCYLPDQYEIPNDLLKKDENLEVGMARILQEQTNLKIRKYGGYLGQHDYKTIRGDSTRMLIFWVEVTQSKVLKAPAEFSHALFVFFDEVQRYGVIDPFYKLLIRFWFGGPIEPEFMQGLITGAQKDGFWRHKVRAAVRQNDGQLLILKRPRKARCLPMAYEFPGGELDYGEDLVDAIKRYLARQTELELDQTLEYLGHFDYTSQRNFENIREFFILVEVAGTAGFKISEHAHGAYVDMRKFSQLQATDSCALQFQAFHERFFGQIIEEQAKIIAK